MTSSTVDLSPDDRRVIARAREVVNALCDELGPFLLSRSGVARATTKADGSPVTDADLLADERIVQRLSAAFPDHEVVSEEGVTTWEGGRWTWVVDPVDGTANFSSGIPYWCTAIALMVDGVPVYGIVDAPAIGTRFEAELERGATRNGIPLRVRDRVDYRTGEHAYVPAATTAGEILRSSGRVLLNARILGSWALDLAHVAAGSLAVAYQAIPKVWDIAAGTLLVTEAGGAYASLGEPLIPLRAGIDLATTSCPGIAGPEEGWLRELHAQL